MKRDLFGDTVSTKMPEHFFDGAILVSHDTAIRANIDKQKYCVAPRHWYVDSVFRCTTCSAEYTWSATEQRAWFEDYGLWVDAQPCQCKACIVDKRRLLSLQSEYDSKVSSARVHGSRELKLRIIEIVTELEKSLTGLPDKMSQTKSLFARQIAKLAEQDDADQPATAPESKTEGEEKPKPESEARSLYPDND